MTTLNASIPQFADSNSCKRWLHWLALATSICTFPLIFVGGLVTSRGAALSVPDWPTSYGYNMFTFPFSMMVGGIFYEHSHRLLGSLVGFLTLTTAAAVWMTTRDRAVRWLAGLSLLAVSIQGVLGGLRVVLVNENIAIFHAVLAQTFFIMTVALVLMTSPTWEQLKVQRPENSRLRFLSAAAVLVVYTQIILGAVTRHTQLLLWAHVFGAGLVVLGVAAATVETWWWHRSERVLLRPATLMSLLMLTQIGIGLWAMVLRVGRDPDLPITPIEAAVPTIHVALGALTFACCVVLALRVWKMPPASAATHGAPIILGPLVHPSNT